MNEKKKKIAIPLAILCGGLAIATTALIAIKARRHKIANQLQKENLLQNFKKLQKQLNELLGYKIVNEINVFHEQEVLQGSLKINNKSETKVIEEETLTLKDAITLLISKIKNQINQKELEFAKFNEIKDKLQEYIKNELSKQEYEHIKQNIENELNKYTPISLESTLIEIQNATNNLIKLLNESTKEKDNIDNLNAKEQLKASISQANQLLPQLSDNDSEIAKAKKSLDVEIQKANQAVASNNTASMQSAKESLDAKIAQVNQQLQQFNKDKESKFAELEQTRKNIDNFLTPEVKNNPNYSALVRDLTNAKDAKKSVSESSNKSDIIAANQALQQALANANNAKTQVDNENKSIKQQLNALIAKANTLSGKLTDNDNDIKQAKSSLDAEIANANKAVNQNNNALMNSSKSSLDAKITDITKKLEAFNATKKSEFTKLQETRSNIDKFLTPEVKNNPNYSALVRDLTNAKDAKKSVSESSNKSDIIAANQALQQALANANNAKTQVDNENKSIKQQLNALIAKANTLSGKLTDNDNDIKQAKSSLDAEIANANKAVNQNNNALMNSSKSSLDAKITDITKKLEAFNATKKSEFTKLQETRSNIDKFLTPEVKNNPNYSALVRDLTNAKDAKKSVSESSNKSDIIAANQALQQALNTAKAKKSSIDNELKPLKDDLQSKIEEFGPIRNTNFSWISSKLENAKNKLAEELTKADAIKNNPSSSKQALKDSSQQVQKLGNELLKTITEELGKAETKNSNIGYRLFKLAQAEQFNNTDVDKLKNAWEERQTLLSKKQKLGNQSTKDYLTQLSTEMSTQESTIKKVIVNIQTHIRNNLNSQYRLEADKLIANMKRGYGDKVGIESLQKWQDLMDDSVLSVDDSLKDDFNKALRVLVGDYTKNPPVSSWFINKRNRSIENYQNLRNLILVRENEILLDKAKDLDKRAEKTIKFVDENINNLGQRAKTLKQEILNAKKDLSNFTLNHQKNQFTAKDITPKISLLENKLNEINQYLLPIIKQKAQSKISEIEKNKKELEDIIRSNFYLWEKNEINKYISELTNKQVNLRSNINFENKWESIKDTLDNLNIKENVSLLKEVIINNSNAQYSINRILSTVPEFIKVAQTTRSNNLRSLSEQFKFVLLDINKYLKEVKKILDENKTLNKDNITKLNEKIRLFVDKSRELKESLRWFDRQNENISDQGIKNKLDEVRELLKNV
ncbi:hypothetical protein ACP0BH_01005 [Metamycoplasma hominis]|uniref:hypothetical protein n=2 Tax=Metamycoplasma hominis TaxID=2098 RepID=UPI003CEACBD1